MIGAGPRGTSVLERLLANWAAAGPAGTLHIDVIDPYPAGPGHVWQPGQSRLYLMNTQSFYPTVVPEDPALAPPLAGNTFDHWRELQQRHPHPSLTDEERAEVSGLGATDFPSRALYGRYLRSTLEELLTRLPAGVTVDFHPATATSVRHAPAPARPQPRRGTAAPVESAAPEETPVRFDVVLDDGAVLTVDSVVLALGHLDARLNGEQRELLSAAEELGLLYVPPAAPADVDWSRVPAGKPVLVRGMGLNFFDVMGQLTEGRGGRFVAAEGNDELTYLPSGREPLIIAASRRGTPYRAKATLDGYYPAAVQLRYCTEDAIAKFAETGIRPSFDYRPVAAPAAGRDLGLLLDARALAARCHPDRPGRVPAGTGRVPAAARAFDRKVGTHRGIGHCRSRPGSPPPGSARPRGAAGRALVWHPG